MSLFMGDPKLLCPPGLKQPEGQLYAQDNSTLSLVACQHNGHFHVAVSELTLAQLKELARQCQASLEAGPFSGVKHGNRHGMVHEPGR